MKAARNWNAKYVLGVLEHPIEYIFIHDLSNTF